MLRLNPVGYYRLVQASQFESSYAGGEANVAVSLANYGMSAAFVTKVPEHEIGQCAVNAMRQFGVDTTHMYRGGSRLGVYYAEKGASQRPSKVIYDRAGSSIATAKPEEFQWDEIFRDADWFHFTGITPALGGDLPKICLDACKAAKKRGLTVSCDLNYRKKLWSREDAGRVMAELMPYTKALLSAIPEPDISMRNKEIKVIKGEVVSPVDPKPGCRFAARCEYCQERCTQEAPTLKEVSPGHFVACHLCEN